MLWFIAKVMIFVFVFIWLRGTLPRLRYDQFMAFGWKRLIPIALVWIMAVAAIRAASLGGGFDRRYLAVAAGVIVVMLVGMFFLGGEQEEAGASGVDKSREPATDQPFDAFAGGYPVPPMPGQSVGTAATVSSSASSTTAREQ